MVRFTTIKQKAKIILNSDDAVKTINTSHIIPVRDDTIRFDGSSGSVVDIANDRITILDHRLYQGEGVIYTAGTTAITGLTTATTYYVILISPNVIKLASTPENAIAGTAVDLTGVGTGTQTFTRTMSFDGGLASVVDIADGVDSIKFATEHYFNTGDYVQYTTSTTAIVGLTNNQYYYVVVIDTTTIKLAVSFQNATSTTPSYVDFTGLGGAGANTHNIKKVITFDSSASPVVDLVNERINIPAHNLNTGDYVLYQVDTLGYATGTAVGGLQDNMYYYVISVDPDSIKLADSKVNALAGKHINLTAVGTGSNHSLTRIVLDTVQVCTNYKFKLTVLPNNLNEKCRMAIESFNYVKNYGTANCKSVGGVYVKSILPTETYSSQGYYKGTLLLPAHFGNSIAYANNNVEYNSVPVPHNMTQLLQNGLDIFIDSKKRNFSNQDISGCINEDTFSLTLLVYEVDEFESIKDELNEKTKNYANVRAI